MPTATLLGMENRVTELKQTPAWHSLLVHRRMVVELSLKELFAKDPHRFRRFSVDFDGLLFDFSKNLITEDTVRLLTELATESGLEEWRRKLFAGEAVNHTEQRPALHMALRSSAGEPLVVEGEDVRAQVRESLERMDKLATAVRDGSLCGYTGETITDVVHIGIGGSDLGPRLVLKALADRHDGPRVHFVSNVDGVELAESLDRLRPETTLFTVVSKSFGTMETLTNARAARDWFTAAGADQAAVGRHFIGISSNVEKAQAFGLDPENIFPIWDWVGGRYSVWSAVGLPVAIACGMPAFRELLAGAEAMDKHFLEAPLARNLPVMLGLLGVWYANFLGFGAQAIIPYSERLSVFPAYLQQLEMESNGKQVDRAGRQVNYQTVPVLWGQTGTVGQHAFFQALHQGTQPVPADFIGVARPQTRFEEHHEQLTANLFAQTEALMRGQTAAEARAQMEAQGLSEEQTNALLPYRVFPGNRPTNTLLLKELSPRLVGMLVALYEHKVFTQSVIWRLNAFDQWGVELGKKLADGLLPALRSGQGLDQHDASTRGLVEHYRTWSERS
jgi:glucose-6-phosphate isomerase